MQVSVRGHALAGHFIGGGGHILHARGINPSIVEIEEATNGDGIVDGLFGPARLLHFVHIFLSYLVRAAVDFVYEGEKRLLRFG